MNTVHNAVGIDVSKGKNMVVILRPFGEIISGPFEVHNTSNEINEMIKTLKELDGDTKVVMEHTGRYFEPIAHGLTDAGLFVSAVNPKLIKDFDNDSLRKVKTDKADSLKIARYTLDKWHKLKQYSVMDELRNQLKTMNRQYGFYTKHKTAFKNNLISLLDLTFPGANDFFDSPVRKDGSQKWVDFVSTYWHVEIVRNMSLVAFTRHYSNWCLRKGYNFQEHKAKEIYSVAKTLLPVLPRDAVTKALIKDAVNQVNTASITATELRAQMNAVAAKLPEYPIVMAMSGVGTVLGPQLIAEIGDIRRFTHRSAITAFAGVDPGNDESGTRKKKSVRTTKCGSSSLRQTLFLVMKSLMVLAPVDDPVYAFMMKKKSEGKEYFVYMTAGMNKFMRIYYGRLKEYYAEHPEID